MIIDINEPNEKIFKKVLSDYDKYSKETKNQLKELPKELALKLIDAQYGFDERKNKQIVFVISFLSKDGKIVHGKVYGSEKQLLKELNKLRGKGS